MLSVISKSILRLLGWKITGRYPHELNKFIIVVMPHTSNWDFPLGLLVRSALKARNIKFVAKDSLFKPPFGAIFRALGGYPIDRSGGLGYVDAVVKIIKREPKFVLTVTPEGTRSKVDKLKTGFYYIALGAEVPLVLVSFDYGKKEVAWSKPFYPTGDKEKDFAEILKFFKGAKGKHPELGYTPNTKHQNAKR